MDKVLLAVKSRTVWTIVAMFVIGGVGAVNQYIPVEARPLVEGALALLAMYFRVNPQAQA